MKKGHTEGRSRLSEHTHPYESTQAALKMKVGLRWGLGGYS